MGGIPPYTYTWNGLPGLSTESGICSGDTVELYISDARGCVDFERIYVPYLDVEAPAIFPNPSPGEALMAFDAPDAGQVEIRVLDATGRMLYQAERRSQRGPQRSPTVDGPPPSRPVRGARPLRLPPRRPIRTHGIGGGESNYPLKLFSISGIYTANLADRKNFMDKLGPL